MKACQMKIWLSAAVFISVFFSVTSKAQVSLGALEPGPYGRGSNITLPVVVPVLNNCLPASNTFQLFLSDPAGTNLTNTQIGGFTGFYTTFVNGIIPAGVAAGSGYRISVRTTGDNVLYTYPTPITIRAVTVNALGIIPSQIPQRLGPDVFGFCGSSVSDNQSVNLTNTSGTGVVPALTIRNEVSGITQNYTLSGSSFSVNGINNSYYTATLKGEQVIGAETIKNNRSYLLLNSSLRISIQSTGDGFGCLDPVSAAGALLEYSVNINDAGGIKNNYPGAIYTIRWGDGTTEDILTHCQLLAQNGKISHVFNTTSCGQPPIDLGNGNQELNAFNVNITSRNPFCTQTNSAITYAKIFLKPEARIQGTAATVCANVNTTIQNNTIDGTNANCSTNMLFDWYVDGVFVTSAYNLTYNFPPGTHTIRLVARNDVGICSPSEITRQICAQEAPRPMFTLPAVTATCHPVDITPADNSVIDNTCGNGATYVWSVIPSTGVTITNGNTPSPTIRFTVPGQVTVRLRLTNAGCSPQQHDEVITPLIPGTVIAAAGPDQNLCSAALVTLAGNIPSPDLGMWSSISGPPVIFTDATAPGTTVAGLLPGQVYVFRWTITGSNGCVSIDEVTINNLLPLVNVLNSPPAVTVCTGQVFTLVNNPPSGGTGTYLYSWEGSNDDGISWGVISGQTGANLTITISNNVKVRRIIRSLPCELVSNIISLRALPPITGNSISGNQTVCSGLPTSAITGSQPSGGDGTYTYSWEVSANGTTYTTIPGALGVSYNPPPATATTYYRRRVSSGPCARTLSGVSNVVTIQVKSNFTSAFSPDKTIGCAPLTVTFTNTSQGDGLTFIYDFGDGSPVLPTNSMGNVSHTYNVTEVTDFTVRLRATNDCTTHESSYIIRVLPNNIIPELVVNGNVLRGCAPFMVTFANNSIGANAFIYNFGDGSVVQTNHAPETIQHTFLIPGTYEVVLTASNGCSTAFTTETIVVLAQPDISFAAETTIACSGTGLKFKNTSAGAVSYIWDFGDGTISTQAEPVHIYTGAGRTYTVTLTGLNSLGCSRTVTQLNYITVPPQPVPLFEVRPGSRIRQPDFTFTFENLSSPDAVTWKWDFGDGTVSISRSPIHVYGDTGIFTVRLTAITKEGCQAVSSQAVQVIGVPGSLLMPNAFMPGGQKEDLRRFAAKGRGIKEWHLSIFNKWGQVLWETTKLESEAPAESWDGTFNGQPQPQGTYYWKAEVKFLNGSEWKGVTLNSAPAKKTGIIYLIR